MTTKADIQKARDWVGRFVMGKYDEPFNTIHALLSGDLEAVKAVLPEGYVLVPSVAAHEWNSDGEKCIKCGDSDWYAGPVCSESKIKAAQENGGDDD